MPSPKIFYGWWIVSACFVLSFFVGGIAFWGFTAYFTPLVNEFGWSYTQISFASSLRGLEMGILAPLMGFLVDRLSPRRVVFASVLLISLGLFVLSHTQSLITFYLSIIFLGFGTGGCTSVVLMTAVAKWFRKRLSLAMGIMVSGFGASGLMTPAVVWLIDTYGWRETLIIKAVAMLIIGLPLAAVIRSSPEHYGLEPDGIKSPPQSGSQPKPPPETSLSLRHVWRSSSFTCLLLVETVRFMAVAAVGLHVMPYLESLGIERSLAGMVAMGIPVFSILGRVGFGYLGDHIDKRRAFTFTLSAMSAGLLVFAWVGEIWTIVLFLLLFPPGLGGGMVLRGATIRHSFGPAAFGTLLGAVMGAGALGGMIGSTLAGWSYDFFGSYHQIWYFLALVTATATMLTSRIKPIVQNT